MKRCLNCETTYTGDDWRCPACGFAPEIVDGFPILAPELARQNETYSPDFFARTAELERGHFWFEARVRLILWAIRKYFPDTRRMLEVGCGTGFVLDYTSRCLQLDAVWGSDLLVDVLAFVARQVPSATLLQMDARHMPFAADFDLIGLFDVIEHVREDEAVLAQAYRAVRPGGGVLISVPQHRFLWSVMDDLSYHKRRYSRDELVGKVRRAGFEVLKTTSFVSLLLPLMLAARKRSIRDPEQFDVFNEMKLDPRLNGLLFQVMKVEIALIRAGVTFRWGGSRLLVARRPA